MTNAYDSYDKRLRDAWKHVVQDGESVRVPMQFMDGKRRVAEPAPVKPPPPFRYADARPRSVTMTDAEREARQKLLADQDAKLSNAWKDGADLVEDDDKV